ncbi:MAG TPA: carboxypeptidase regulatory-like domain-containing protein [Ilumatobacteraceae bacterium]|nr:carboxypeptidase regulatory-like domain-containing protein [Ilumatobacteraceae bacterium]
MTSIRVLRTVIDAAPGEVVIGSLEVHNDGPSDAMFRVRVVGTGSESTPFDIEIPAGDTVRCEVPILVAATLGIGQHAAAYEVTSSRLDDPATLTPFTVSIGSVERVALTATPATIRARRRARFHLDVANNEDLPVTIRLDASAPDVEVTFSPDRVDLAPGQRIVTSAKVKGPRHWSGEPTQHNLIVTARGRASSTSITAPYIQRPLFAHRVRMLVAGLTVIALWFGAILGVAVWWPDRDDGAATRIVAVDTDGDGIPDSFFDAAGNPLTAIDTNGDGVPDSFTDAAGNAITGTDTDGDGVPDAFVDADGNPIRGLDTDGDGIVDTFVDANGNSIKRPVAEEVTASRRTTTEVRGTITVAGSLDDVQVALAPIALGAAPAENANVRGFAGAGAGTATKIWSARFGRLDTAIDTRLTQPVPPLSTTPGVDGVWLFGDVLLGQSYEIVFSKPGFDTQSFVITPPSNGAPVELDVELVASVGAISGRITGPGGGLGGAAITVTDGTLTFQTTSATDGNVGSWSLDGLSTPGVYTVSAELRGFGTEVLQVRLGAGERRTSADITMRRGVGTVSGRILGENGRPLGGVTVTATDGATTRTTTSLTEGNIGFFSIPQLGIPSTYTLSVELAGFVTQTRRVTLGGSLDGVDFNLVRSSLRLTGRVTSANGSGIVGAGVTLSTGDLQFRVQTAAAPDAGAFAVDDLPPGLYTITFDHFQHVSATELRTLVAGQPPAPLDVTLQPSSGPPPIGTGSLRVEVIDSAPAAGNPREVANATVVVIDVTTGIEADRDTQAGNNFRFTNLPVATYRLVVSAPSYNTTTIRRVTVGLQERSETVGLQRLGAASGSIVDPTDPDPIASARRFAGDYRVLLYREPRGPADLPFFTTAPANADGVWQTSQDALVTGTYSIVVERLGAGLDGHLIRDAQVIDPTAGGPMRFVVPEGSADPIENLVIVADPYPEISGNVYRADSRPLSGISAIDVDGLAVSMSCPGGTTADATITDVLGQAGLPDSYRISPEQVGRNRLTGNCTLRFTAPGFQTVEHGLNNVQASVGTVRSDRQLNVALTAPAPNIRGTVFWVDSGRDTTDPLLQRVPLDGVQVSSTRITEYLPGVGTLLPRSGAPAIADTTSAGGSWALPGQVFGAADYRFEAAAFDPAIVRFTIDENGLQAPVTVSNAEVTGDLTTGFAVELRSPNPGSIEGTISIETSTTPKYGDVVVTATSPSGEVRTITPTAAGTFTIDPAGAGTWTIQFSEPDNYDFFDPVVPPSDPAEVECIPTLPCQLPVGPGVRDVAVSTSLVELGTLELTLVGVGTPPTEITTAPTVTLTPASLVPGGEAVTATMTRKPGGTANTFVLRNVKVATTNPAGTPVPYLLSIALANFDTTAAQAIPVSFQAGSIEERTVVLPSFGTVTGTILGRPDTAGTTADVLPIGESTKILVRQLSPEGTPTGAPLTVTTMSNTYSFRGPAGFYRIDVASKGYRPTSAVVEVINDVPARQDFLLDLVPGSIDLTVVRDLVGDVPVPGATYQAFPGSCPQTGTTPTPTRVDADGNADGQITIGSLLPGPYCLTIREIDGNNAEAAFPAIATVMVAKSTTEIPADITTHAPLGTTTTVTAPLPAIRPSVTGTVRAVNRNGDPVPLPASIGLTISYARTVLEVTVNTEPGGTVPNRVIRENVPLDAPLTPASGASSATYSFTNVPVGVHTITPQANIPGYTPVVSPVTVTVGTTGGFGPTPANDIVYVVENLDVLVTLRPPGGGAFPVEEAFLLEAGTVTLAPPGGRAPYIGTIAETSRTIRFRNVAPEIGNFALTIASPLHTYTPADLSFTVPVLPLPAPGPDVNRTQNVDVRATAVVGRVTGSLSQFESSTTSGGMAADTVITLRPASGTGGVQTIRTTGVTTTYFFDAAAGAYEIIVTRDGYTSPLYPVTLVNGRVVPRDLRIDRLAPITATITNTPVPTGTTVWLVRNNNPSDDIQLTRTGTTNSWTLNAAPGSYRFVEARAPGYRPDRKPTGDNPVLNLPIGEPYNQPFTLSPRTLTVNVVQAGGTTSIANATVSLAIPTGGSTVATRTPSPTSSPPYVFRSTDATNAIPVSGSGTATASAPGRRTNTRTFGDLTTESITVALSPLVTATGTINAPDTAAGEQVIWAESPGATTIYGSIEDEEYTIPGLTNLASGAARTWTIKYDKLGVGIGETSLTVDATNTPAAGSVDVQPQPIAVTFTVRSNVPNAPLVDATVTVGTLTGTTRAAQAATETNPGWAAGTVVINVPENLMTWTQSPTPSGSFGWTAAAAPGFATSATQTTTVTSRAPVNAATVTLLSRTLTLTVTKASSPPLNDSQTSAVITCVPASTNPCVVPTVGAPSSGVFTFLPPTAAGNYEFSVTTGPPGNSQTRSTTLTVAATNGVGVLGTNTLAFP